MKIIAFCGYSKVGKDFTATHVIDFLERHEQSAYLSSVAFADELKALLSETLGVPVDVIESHKDAKPFKGINKTIRQMLIDLSERIRRTSPEYWCRVLHQHILSIQKEQVPGALVITDLRKVMEVGYFRTAFGNDFKLVEIVRSPYLHQECGYELAELDGLFHCRYHNYEKNTPSWDMEFCFLCENFKGWMEED